MALWIVYLLGAARTKWAYTLVVASPFSLIVWAINKYIYNDWQFAGSLAVIIACDTVLGMWCAWRENRLSSIGFSKLLTKLVVYMFLLISTHTIANFRIGGTANAMLEWADSLVYSAIMVREFLSILENTSKLGFGLPDHIKKRFEQFDDHTGKPKP